MTKIKHYDALSNQIDAGTQPFVNRWILNAMSNVGVYVLDTNLDTVAWVAPKFLPKSICLILFIRRYVSKSIMVGFIADRNIPVKNNNSSQEF